jgi:predicted Zn-dependent protease
VLQLDLHLIGIYQLLPYFVGGATTPESFHATVCVGKVASSSGPIQPQPGQVARQAAHELGHALRLEHDDAVPGIMQNGVNPDIVTNRFSISSATELRDHARPRGR